MSERTKMIEANEPEVLEIVSVEKVSEASVLDVAQASVGRVVVQKPKRGVGFAAIFGVRKQPQPEPEMAEIFDAPESDPVVMADEDHEEISDEPVAPHKNGQLKSVIECMLFVSDGPLTAKVLADTLEVEECRVDHAISELEEHLDSRGGLKLMRLAGGFQLCTKPEYADYCAMLLQPAKKRLSKAALETLAVVAYRQPCTMPEVEAVRGVAVDGVMKTLTERGLVREAGRKQTPGRPILYATTPEFLEYFGLNTLSELPDIDLLAVEEVKALEAQRELFTGEAADTGSEVESNDGE